MTVSVKGLFFLSGSTKKITNTKYVTQVIKIQCLRVRASTQQICIEIKK